MKPQNGTMVLPGMFSQAGPVAPLPPRPAPSVPSGDIGPETFTERVAALLRANQGKWIDGRTIALVGGAYAWRSRLSDCRRHLGMVIENRQRKVFGVTASEYRFVVDTPVT